MKGSGNGFYGKHHTDEYKKKASELRLGKPNPKLLGHKVSAEARQKMSDANKGRLSVARKKVDQLTLEGEYIRTFDSITQAAVEMTGKTDSHISAVCQGKRSQAYGYK